MNTKIVLSVASMLFAGFLASCGPLSGSTPQKTDANQPIATSNETAQSQGQSALSVPPPVALPPNYGDRPLKPGEMEKATMPNGLPALQPKGVNVETLFAEKVSNSDRRFERLENAVLDLRREFESFKPAITRLVAVETDIQDLIEQLDVLLRNEPTAPPAPLAPAPQPAPTALSPADQAPPPRAGAIAPKPPAPTAQPIANTGGGSTVSSLRIGKHSDKIRLVMDATAKTAFTTDLDNQENLLILEMPNATWSASTAQSFSQSPLLRSYSVEPMNNGQGSRVILALKKPTQILKQQALPPGNNPNYRMYIDLKT